MASSTRLASSFLASSFSLSVLLPFPHSWIKMPLLSGIQFQMCYECYVSISIGNETNTHTRSQSNRYGNSRQRDGILVIINWQCWMKTIVFIHNTVALDGFIATSDNETSMQIEGSVNKLWMEGTKEKWKRMKWCCYIEMYFHNN